MIHHTYVCGITYKEITIHILDAVIMLAFMVLFINTACDNPLDVPLMLPDIFEMYEFSVSEEDA